MKSFAAVGLVAFSRLAAADTVSLIWGMALKTGEEIITASNADGTLLASSCSDQLTLGSTRIKISADSSANGNFTVGDKTLDLGDDNICDALWSESFVEVNCRIDVENLPTQRGSGASLKTSLDCFKKEDEQELLPFVSEEGSAESTDDGEQPQFFESEDMESANPDSAEETGLLQRQVSCVRQRSVTKREPVNPQKFRRHVQLTSNFNCGSGTCSTGYGKTWSVSHGAVFNANGYGKVDWISAGYSVTWSKGGSTTYTCNAEKNQRVCVKNWRRYQQYNVRRSLYFPNRACGAPQIKDYHISSPLSHDRHQEFYCARGTNSCQHEGYVHWEHRGAGYHGGV